MLPIVAQEKPQTSGSLAKASEEQDIALRYWEAREKYYVIVAVDQSVVPGASLPFAKTDATRLSQALEQHGFKKLDLLIGSNASRNNFVHALKQAQCKDSSSLVLVYYSGHGVVAQDNSELWLQLADQPELGDRYGITVRDIVGSARGTCYSGELAIVIDSCFSGLGVLNTSLTLREFGLNTSIFSSSSDVEESYSTKKKDGTEVSAFTDSLIDALTGDYEKADDNSDGFLLWGEASVYSKNRLGGLLKNRLIPKRMEPYEIADPSSLFLAYDRSHVKKWDSPIRQLVDQTALASKLALSGPQLGLRGSSEVALDGPLAISEEAQRIASRLPPKSTGYVAGLKAIAERRFSNARATLELVCAKPGADLRNCYLALARNEMYAGKPADALEWYRKASGFSMPMDIEIQNETAAALLLAPGHRREATTVLSSLVKLQGTMAAEDVRFATTLHNLATAQAAAGKSDLAAANYEHALAIYTKSASPNSIFASTSAFELARVYEKAGQSDKAKSYQELSAQLLPPADATFSSLSFRVASVFGKVVEKDGVLSLIRPSKGQQVFTAIRVLNPWALADHEGQFVRFKGQVLDSDGWGTSLV